MTIKYISQIYTLLWCISFVLFIYLFVCLLQVLLLLLFIISSGDSY